MNSWLYYIALASILLSYISSLRSFRLDMPRHFKHFSFFLLFTLLGEVFAYAWPRLLYEYTPYDRSNQWFYNIFHFIGYCFCFYFFSRILVRANIRRSVVISCILYALFAIGNFFFLQGPVRLNTYSELVASALLVFCSISYYYQLLYAKEVVAIKNDSAFWISTGIFINALGSILGLSLINMMFRYSPDKALTFLLLIQLSGLLTYITFSIAFLCHKKK
jgi:hypothetical protein